MSKAKSRVTSKRQVTLPKSIADRYGIRPGDTIAWEPDGDHLRVSVGESRVPGPLTVAEKLRMFDLATERRNRRGRLLPAGEEEGRGWTREALYDHGGTD